MPPEQIAGDAELTGAVDLYALGCLIFEMLVGRPPFDGNTVIQIFEAHLYNEPTPPVSLVRDCPQDLSELVLLLLEKKPEDAARERGGSAVGAVRTFCKAGRCNSRSGLRKTWRPTSSNDSCQCAEPRMRRDGDEPIHAATWSKSRTLIAMAVIVSMIVVAIAAILAVTTSMTFCWLIDAFAVIFSLARRTAIRLAGIVHSRLRYLTGTPVSCFALSARLHGLTGFDAQLVAGPAVAFGVEQQAFLQVVRQAGDGGVGRPGEARAAVFDRHAAGDRRVAVEHFGRHRAFAHLRKRFAEAVLAGVEQVADPPWPGPLAPQRELQRALPLGSSGLPVIRTPTDVKWNGPTEILGGMVMAFESRVESRESRAGVHDV